MPAQRQPGADRRKIALTGQEVTALLAAEKVAIVSSIGPRGWPHSMPMWYVPDEDRLSIWTSSKSQKVKNLERDPRATLLVESGDTYAELRGVMIEADVRIERDPADTRAFAERLIGRYPELGRGAFADPKALEAQIEKRVVLRFDPARTVSWDHTKMGAGR